MESIYRIFGLNSKGTLILFIECVLCTSITEFEEKRNKEGSTEALYVYCLNTQNIILFPKIRIDVKKQRQLCR